MQLRILNAILKIWNQTTIHKMFDVPYYTISYYSHYHLGLVHNYPVYKERGAFNSPFRAFLFSLTKI